MITIKIVIFVNFKCNIEKITAISIQNAILKTIDNIKDSKKSFCLKIECKNNPGKIRIKHNTEINLIKIGIGLTIKNKRFNKKNIRNPKILFIIFNNVKKKRRIINLIIY